MKTGKEPDPEIVAISEVYNALSKLDPDAQQRVLEYVSKKLGLSLPKFPPQKEETKDETELRSAEDKQQEAENPVTEENDEDDGISPIAKKWMRRSGLDSKQLSTLFSIGGDDIDLVANKIPGTSLRRRMRSVFLLKGIAAYLSGGAPRFTHEQVKETCIHYDAYDRPNFAACVKNLASEVSGSKESGYSLTARGLAAATELIQETLGSKNSE